MGIQPSKLGIYVIGLNDDTMAAWWLTYRSEKYESQLEWWHSQYMEKKHVLNHQPAYVQYIYI